MTLSRSFGTIKNHRKVSRKLLILKPELHELRDYKFSVDPEKAHHQVWMMSRE